MYEDTFLYKTGDLVKPYSGTGGGSESFSRRNFADDLNKFLDEKMTVLGANEFRDRFGTLPCMLISSQFGGGYWDTDDGKELKSHLSKAYPDFYANFPQVNLGKNQRDLNETSLGSLQAAQQVNQWLRDNGVVDLVTNAKELSAQKQILPEHVDQLGASKRSHVARAQ